MLEYVCFDFSPFSDDIDKKAHSLREFLGFVDKQDALESFNQCRFFTKIAKDVASGLCYLRSKDIVHRDLKTANVLVSNQHYSNMTSEEDFSKACRKIQSCAKSPTLAKAGHGWCRQHSWFTLAHND